MNNTRPSLQRDSESALSKNYYVCIKKVSLRSRNNTFAYTAFSKGLLDEIEQKANQFSTIGLVDTELGDSVDGKIVVLKTSDLREANENLQGIDLEEIRWFINMDSQSSKTMAFILKGAAFSGAATMRAEPTAVCG